MSNGWIEIISLIAGLVVLTVALVYGFAAYITRDEDGRGYPTDDEYPRAQVRNVTPDPLDPRRAGWWPHDDAA